MHVPRTVTMAVIIAQEVARVLVQVVQDVLAVAVTVTRALEVCGA